MDFLAQIRNQAGASRGAISNTPSLTVVGTSSKKLSKVAAEIIFLKKFENAGGDGQEDARQACARCACCLRPKGNCGCGHVPRIHTCHSRTMRSRHLHASPCLVCNTHHPDEALRWTSFVVGSRDAARSATSTSCTLPDTVIQLSTFERISRSTRARCVCVRARHSCARVRSRP